MHYRLSHENELVCKQGNNNIIIMFINILVNHQTSEMTENLPESRKEDTMGRKNVQ